MESSRTGSNAVIEKFTLVLGLPPKELNPNSRPHFRKKAEKTKGYRLHAAENGKIGMREILSKSMPWRYVSIRATYFHKTWRFLDRDNILASLKSAFDGMVDAGILTDDKDVTHLPVVREYDNVNPRVEIIVYRSDDDDE